jgi:hypothetical protein
MKNYYFGWKLLLDSFEKYEHVYVLFRQSRLYALFGECMLGNILSFRVAFLSALNASTQSTRF